MNLNQDFLEGEQQTLFLARALQAREDCRVALVCCEGSKLHAQALMLGLAAFTLSVGVMGKITGKLKLRLFFRRNPGKWILHAHDDRSVRLGAAVARKNSSLMLIASRHTPAKLADSKLADNFRSAKIVACETQEIAYVVAEGKIAPRALKIVHGGIDPDYYRPRLTRNDNRIILACTGRLTPGKGHEQLIRALKTFQETSWVPPWELRITGSGPLFQPLLELATELGVASRLAFLGGQEAGVVLPDCDILIAPADSGEGCSMSILEGWITGLPVVCSDTMAHNEIATDGQNALFFRSGNPEDLAAKMLLLCKDAHLREYLVEGGRNAAEAHSSRVLAENYLEHYKRVLMF